MNKTEYTKMQDMLNAEMDQNLYAQYGKSGKWVDGFKKGVLVAKSVLHDEYESQQRKKQQKEGEQR